MKWSDIEKIILSPFHSFFNFLLLSSSLNLKKTNASLIILKRVTSLSLSSLPILIPKISNNLNFLEILKGFLGWYISIFLSNLLSWILSVVSVNIFTLYFFDKKFAYLIKVVLIPPLSIKGQ